MADFEVVHICFTGIHHCRERLADVEESVAERSSAVHRQLQRVFSPLQVCSRVTTFFFFFQCTSGCRALPQPLW